MSHQTEKPSRSKASANALALALSSRVYERKTSDIISPLSQLAQFRSNPVQNITQLAMESNEETPRVQTSLAQGVAIPHGEEWQLTTNRVYKATVRSRLRLRHKANVRLPLSGPKTCQSENHPIQAIEIATKRTHFFKTQGRAGG